MSAATNEKRWTVLELLQWTTSYFAERGIDTARLDAECLLAHALGTPRLGLYLDFEKPASPEERTRFRELVTRRADERVPVAQLLGSKEFWSLPLEVTPDVLVPRPDTETLVEATLQGLRAQGLRAQGLRAREEGAIEILDLGTGSGAIALALAKEFSQAKVVAVDRSAAALAVAERNAESLELAERVEFLLGDLFQPVEDRRFDAVVSNPPYLAEAEAAGLAPELAHEPKEALFAGPLGTEILERIVRDATPHLNPGAWFALELAPEQAELVAGWLQQRGFVEVQVHRDLGERARVVSARRATGED